MKYTLTSINLLLLVLAAASFAQQTPDPAALNRASVVNSDKFWERLADPEKYNISSRDLFLYGLALCEAGEHPERLARLFDLGRQMQDHDPQSKGYGNLRWYWSNPGVLDFNAVDFCMQSASVLWVRHRDTMSAEARETLRDVIGLAIQGSLNHKPKPSYTNIALMNATNLILLGESLEKPDVAAEGYRRLDGVFESIRKIGIHEYGSPTYYGVDLNDLLCLEALTRNDRARKQAQALLELFWTDIALNWFEPAHRYSGPNSRTYDYLFGHGTLDHTLIMNGWLNTDPGKTERESIVYSCLAKWHPPAALRNLNLNRFPRTVRQAWGENDSERRTHYLAHDVTLGCSGANYPDMDMPLTVDLAGTPDMPRCYFVPDGRHDPFGIVKIPEIKSGHNKALHIKPFFAGAQRSLDALGLVVYRDTDVAENTQTLESHFVIPMAIDALHVGDRPIELENEPWSVEVKPDEAVTLHCGTAVVGVRVVWTRACDGTPAPVSLVYDGNKFKAMRLTVDHRMGRGTARAGAAFWVRVGSDVKTDADYDKWRRRFSVEKTESDVTPDLLQLKVPGTNGVISVAAKEPFKTPVTLDPSVPRVVLEINGEDIGTKILDASGSGPNHDR